MLMDECRGMMNSTSRKKMMTDFSLQTTGVFGADEVKSVSATEGDSVSLHTDVTEVQRDDQILWMFGPKETRIAEIYRKNISTYHCNRTFGDRLQMSNRTGSLTIGNVRTEHSGLYKVQIVTNEATSCKTIKLTVYACLPLPVITSKSLNCSSSSSSSSSPSSSSSKHSSVSNCSLLCSAVNVGDVTLSWYKGNSLLSSISVSDLSISLSLPLEVEYQENNIYSCVINNPITNQTTHLDITQLCHTCPDENEDIRYATAEFVAHPLHHTTPDGEDEIVYSSVAAPKE
ncbi:CD48 antigen-like [Carassius auratus]|uniref:CD48 antigen-like n=1 Tax=Carassius auratus TaxID=7957 RepID=A0A6P6PGM6_CARAU|nr:CD48 antigen-like [Carassius auratus]